MLLFLQELPSLPLLFTIIIFLFTIINQYKKSKSHCSTPKLPPGPWKLPIIGNLHHLIGSSDLYHHTFTNLAKKHGPIMHLQLGKMPVVLISSPEIAEEVLKTQEIKFAQRFQLLDAEDTPYPDSSLIFAPYNEYWKQIRRLSVTDLFSVKRVQSFRSVREEEVWSMVESIISSSSRGNIIPINISEKFFLFTNNIVTRSVLGNKSNYLEEFNLSLEEVIKSTKGFDLGDLFPFLKFLRLVNGKRSGLKRVFNRMDKVLNAIIDEHKAKREAMATMDNNKLEDEDLLDVLLNIQGSDLPSSALTLDHIKNLILDIFASGSMAARSVLEWAMAEMLKNPRVMEKAQSEVRNAFDQKRTKLREEDTQGLPYLNSIIKETMRLHMSTPLIPRESREPCQINGFDIPEKTKILVNVWAMSRDPKYWSYAECFQPEKFLVSNCTNFGMEYIPFGAGRRRCPGGSFGLTSIELALAQLLYHFDWKLPQGVKPEELDMNEAFEITTRRKNDLYVVAIPI